MVNIDSNQGRIGEFLWWINSDPSTIHTVDLPLVANPASVKMVLWGTCGFGQNIYAVMAPVHG